MDIYVETFKIKVKVTGHFWKNFNDILLKLRQRNFFTCFVPMYECEIFSGINFWVQSFDILTIHFD